MVMIKRSRMAGVSPRAGKEGFLCSLRKWQLFCLPGLFTFMLIFDVVVFQSNVLENSAGASSAVAHGRIELRNERAYLHEALLSPLRMFFSPSSLLPLPLSPIVTPL
jgi:hypothetical protein